MSPITSLEVRGLVSMIYNPDYEVHDGDGMEEALDACVVRGLATGHLSEDGAWMIWEPTELGFLALRVFEAIAYA
jgi:hypothetical protein